LDLDSYPFHDKPVLLGTAFLAYTFGLRHAADADHIAAIDNVTRKLMQEGQIPLSVGFFFSLGHSTIVVIASLAVYLGATVVEKQLDAVKNVAGIVSTAISVWDFIGSLNDNFGTLGFVIIGVFLLSWVGSVVIYRVKGFDRVESTSVPME
jgi:high-affinity nickel permease